MQMQLITANNLSSAILNLQPTIVFCQIERTVFPGLSPNTPEVQPVDTGISQLCALPAIFPLSICFFSQLPTPFVAELLQSAEISGPQLWILDVTALAPMQPFATQLRYGCLAVLTAQTMMILIGAHPGALAIYDCADLIYARAAFAHHLRQQRCSFRPFSSLADCALDLRRTLQKQQLRHRPTAVAFRERFFLQE